jgi:hypothetical protein
VTLGILALKALKAPKVFKGKLGRKAFRVRLAHKGQKAIRVTLGRRVKKATKGIRATQEIRVQLVLQAQQAPMKLVAPRLLLASLVF